MSTCLSFIVAFLYTSFGLAQPSVDFERAKKLLDEGKYTKAMHLFKDVSTSNTQYSLDASYLCGVAAYHDHRYADARFILTKICNEAPNYKNIDEVYFLLSRVAFEEQQYFKALKYLETIDSKSFVQDIRTIKKAYLKNVSSEQIMALQQHFQSDKLVAEIALSTLEKIKNKSEKNKLQIEYLKQEYSLRSTTEKVSKKQNNLNVAVLLSFHLDDAKMWSESSRFYELYQGVKVAVDSLNKIGVKINLMAYDTKRDTNQLKKILDYPEVKQLDVCIGPVVNTQSKIMMRYAEKHKIVCVNPLYSNDQLVQGNSFGFLLKPSHEIIANQTANYASSVFDKNKKVWVVFDKTSKDSTLAHKYKIRIKSEGFNSVELVGIHPKNAKELTLKLERTDSTSISHFFVVADDPSIQSSLMKGLEVRNIVAPVVTSYRWLESGLITIDQFKRRDFYFIHPEYIDFGSSTVQRFKQLFKEQYGYMPLSYDAHVGFDIMMKIAEVSDGAVGESLAIRLRTSSPSRGNATSGTYFNKGQINQIVPIIRFDENSQWKWVNEPK